MKECRVIVIVILCMLCYIPFVAIADEDTDKEEVLTIAKNYFMETTGFEPTFLDRFVFGITGENEMAWYVEFHYRPEAEIAYRQPRVDQLVFHVSIEKETKRVRPSSDNIEFINDFIEYHVNEMEYLYIAKLKEEWSKQYGTPWRFWRYDIKAVFCERYGARLDIHLSSIEQPQYILPSDEDISYEDALRLAYDTLIDNTDETQETMNGYYLEAAFFHAVRSEELDKGWHFWFYEKAAIGGYVTKYYVIVRSPQADLYYAAEFRCYILDSGVERRGINLEIGEVYYSFFY